MQASLCGAHPRYHTLLSSTWRQANICYDSICEVFFLILILAAAILRYKEETVSFISR